MEKILTLDPKKNSYVLVGYIDGEDFIKDVDSRKHKFVKFCKPLGMYAIQEDVFPRIIAKGVKRIIIRELDTGNVFVSFVEEWLSHGDWTHGDQRTLAVKDMIQRK